MEAIISLLVLAAFLYVGYRIVKFWAYQRSCTKAYQRVGRRYNGSAPNAGVTHSFFISKPTLSFPYRDTFCQLRTKRSTEFNGREVTELRIQLKNGLRSLEITTGEFVRRNFQRGAGETLELDDQLLRGKFRAVCTCQKEAQPLITSSVVWQLEQLRRHTGSDHVSVMVKKSILLIRKPGMIRDFQQLDDFVRYGLQLYDQLLLAKAQGIEFVNDEKASVIDDVKCPICSEEIVHDMVVCTRCKTPHCRDCWQYNGQCATFACSETRFLQVG